MNNPYSVIGFATYAEVGDSDANKPTDRSPIIPPTP